MATDSRYVLRADDDGVTTLTLNRGDRYNPLSTAMIAELDAALVAVAADATVRVVVLTGAGRGFSAGHDLAELRAHVGDTAWLRRLFDDCATMMTRLTELPQPVIAQVHGIATAAGCQLVSMCDLAVAADTARFALPGVNVGIFCSTPAVGVARNVGRKQAMQLLLTGQPIDAATAQDWGLVNRVVPAAELAVAVTEWARLIASRSAAVVAGGKRAFYRQLDQPLAGAYQVAGEAMICDLNGPDSVEGIDAFLGKREPVFSHPSGDR